MQHPRLLSRVFRNALSRQRCSKEIPTGSTAVRSFASARPLQEEQHRINMLGTSGGKAKVGVHENVRPFAEAEFSAAKSKKEHQSPSEIHYTGNATMPLTSVLHIVKPGEDTPRGIWPVFRLMVCHDVVMVLGSVGCICYVLIVLTTPRRRFHS